jgi:hypothetical protein
MLWVIEVQALKKNCSTLLHSNLREKGANIIDMYKYNKKKSIEKYKENVCSL